MKVSMAVLGLVLIWLAGTTYASIEREYLSEYYGLDLDNVSCDLYRDQPGPENTLTSWQSVAPSDTVRSLIAASPGVPIPAVGGFSLFTDETRHAPGLVGSYFNKNLRSVDQLDWRLHQSVAGTRVDPQVDFTEGGWGRRRDVGLTSGTDSDWGNFSVQWDGVIVVEQTGTRIQLRSDDSSRMWIDVNKDNQFENSSSELIDNNWGYPQAPTLSLPSAALALSVYRVRIQYEESSGGNVMQLLPAAPHVIRIAYLVPSNRTPQKDAVAKLQTMMLRVREWYGEQMNRFSFDSRTFCMETESDGVTPKIYVCQVAETDAQIREDMWGCTLNAAQNAGVPLWSSGQIWLLVPETHLQKPDGSVIGGAALGASSGSGSDAGVAVVGSDFVARFSESLLTDNRAYQGCVIPEIGPYPLVQSVSFPWFEGNTFSSLCSSITGAVAHELGHAIAGLPHNPINDKNFHGNVMGNGLRGFRGWAYPQLYPDEDMRLSYASAIVLKNSRYFNRDGSITENAGPSATFLPSIAKLYTETSLKVPGLVGSYFNRNLRLSNVQDWRQDYSVSGTRIDAYIAFHTGDWGDRSQVGITGGSNDNWDNFSVQWDGIIQITGDKVQLKLKSDDNSRMWIDLNKDGRFDNSSECLDNNWSGQNGGSGTGQPSAVISKGIYATRIQYEESYWGNEIELLVHNVEMQPVKGRIELLCYARDSAGLSAAVLCNPDGVIAEQAIAGTEADLTIIPIKCDVSKWNEVTLAIYDVQGNKSEIPFGFSVKQRSNRSPIPTVFVYHSQATVGKPIAFDATASSDPDGATDPFVVEWDSDGDGVFDTIPSTIKIHTHIPERSGTVRIRARLTDSQGGYSISSPIAVTIRSD